jgi:hypothetical protein
MASLVESTGSVCGVLWWEPAGLAIAQAADVGDATWLGGACEGMMLVGASSASVSDATSFTVPVVSDTLTTLASAPCHGPESTDVVGMLDNGRSSPVEAGQGDGEIVSVSTIVLGLCIASCSASWSTGGSNDPESNDPVSLQGPGERGGSSSGAIWAPARWSAAYDWSMRCIVLQSGSDMDVL